MIYDLNKIILKESILFSSKNIEYNLDKWKIGSDNILFITGLSGSGKSTIAEKYEKEIENCTMFELDGLEFNYDSSDCNILEKVKKSLPEYNKNINNKFKNITNEGKAKLLLKAGKKAINIMHSISNKLFIVEGLQIYDLFNPSYIANRPLIILGTSATESMIRRLKRNNKNELKMQDIVKLLNYYWKENDKLNKFKKEINRS